MSEVKKDKVEAQLTANRDIIDEVDRELTNLLNKRATIALIVAAIKRENNMEVFVPAREDAVIQKVMSFNKGPLTDLQMADLFHTIIKQSKVLQYAYIQQDTV